MAISYFSEVSNSLLLNSVNILAMSLLLPLNTRGLSSEEIA
jgi:hypothetical protein